jgi:hypothetical protein
VTSSDADPALRRFERDAVGVCLAMAVIAFVAGALRQDVAAAARAALGVVGGGLLLAFSYRAIKGAADVVAEVATGRSRADAPDARPVLSAGRRAFLAVKFFTRYALLAVAAYVMLTCFRLHPVGVLAGATSPFVAALVQAARMFRAGRQHP